MPIITYAVVLYSKFLDRCLTSTLGLFSERWMLTSNPFTSRNSPLPTNPRSSHAPTIPQYDSGTFPLKRLYPRSPTTQTTSERVKSHNPIPTSSSQALTTPLCGYSTQEQENVRWSWVAVLLKRLKAQRPSSKSSCFLLVPPRFLPLVPFFVYGIWLLVGDVCARSQIIRKPSPQ